MKYEQINGNIVLTEYDSFSIAETLECGQCFRFQKIDDEDYIIIAFKKLLRVAKKDNNIIFYNTSIEDFENIWINYFDLNRDYNQLKQLLSKNDSILAEAVKFAPGIRILNQDFFECLISFIISQNNRIPMIKKVIENISIKWGDYLGEFNSQSFYSFPDPEKLINISESELMECKTGFRAKYIIDAIKKYMDGEIIYNDYASMPTAMVKDNLMIIKGVGTKVADCVMLFSCGKSDAFPTDVWVKRIMSHFYFDENEASIKEIHKLAEEKFENYAGFAQQYLFNYARQLKIGTNKK